MLQKIWGQIGYASRPSDEEAYRVFDQMDEDGNGSVSIDEFVRFMLAIMQKLYFLPLRDYLIAEGFNLR